MGVKMQTTYEFLLTPLFLRQSFAQINVKSIVLLTGLCKFNYIVLDIF